MPTTRTGSMLATLVLVCALPASATEEQAAQQPAQQAAPATPAFVYQPPNRGAPAERVGGGTRSISQLEVLAPGHTALTTQATPRLYWYINPGFRNKVRFRIGEAGVTPPLLEILLEPQPNGGIQHIDLAAHKVRLEPGKLYEWGVLLEPFPHQRMPPLVSLGRIVLDDSAAGTLAQVDVRQRPYAAAYKGFWYDALDGVSQQIESANGDPQLRLRRAGLLDQGGLQTAASYEREMVGYAR
ncbi:MAG: DUF928 domain-containing protein [Chromatiaceae bacterium]|nr:DUF928 domain-containing protein [Gammaproteobacteria bacterium]MCP5305120.1 DUF928 domain-containing protein [Chromatiaceae bacterium]MCP5315079.1 DUF928 domain-containing protein [Chromatiaceae bacterium]